MLATLSDHTALKYEQTMYHIVNCDKGSDMTKCKTRIWTSEPTVVIVSWLIVGGYRNVKQLKQETVDDVIAA